MEQSQPTQIKRPVGRPKSINPIPKDIKGPHYTYTMIYNEKVYMTHTKKELADIVGRSISYIDRIILNLNKKPIPNIKITRVSN